MYEDILEKVLFSKEQLAKRIKELAEQLDKDYAGKLRLWLRYSKAA